MGAAHGWCGGDDSGRPEADAGLIAFSGRDGDGGLRSSPATSAGSAGRRSLAGQRVSGLPRRERDGQ